MQRMNSAATIATFCLIALPCTVLNSFTFPWFVKMTEIYYPVIIFGVLLQVLTFFCFFYTVFSNPGIVPKGKPAELVYDPFTQMIRQQGPPKYQSIVVQGQLLRMKYCNTCKIYRCPRTVHCSVCDNCVERFDHHCPWVGNCIGRLNYRYFYMFLSVVSCLTIFVMTISIVKCVILFRGELRDFETFRNAVIRLKDQFWDVLVLFIYTTIMIWFVLGLCIYHTYLVSTNKSTYEQIKGYYEIRPNPWDRGFVCNLYTTLCQNLPEPSEQYVLFSGCYRFACFRDENKSPENRHMAFKSAEHAVSSQTSHSKLFAASNSLDLSSRPVFT